MLHFIGIFFPAFLSLSVFSLLSEPSPSVPIRSYLQNYACFTLLDVSTAIVIVKVLKPGLPLTSTFGFNESFLGATYFVSVILAAVFWGYSSKIVHTYFFVKVEEREYHED